MSWPTQPKVRLAVTRFSPDKPVAGLTPEERAAHRERRQAECAKVEPVIPMEEMDVGYDPPERFEREEYPDRRYDRIPSWERFRE